MNTFSKIILSSVVGITSIFTGVEAQAANCYFTTSDAHICIHGVKSNRYGTQKTVFYTINGTEYVDDVTCDPSLRYNYKQNLWGKACFEYSFW